jgi:carbon-monoxide dehydrogenase medium subunit
LYWDHYHVPQTVTEALTLLAENEGNARVIAGGTDLMLQIRAREIKVSALVDLSAIKGLSGISEEDGWIKIGALTTHAQLAASPLIQARARVLAEAAASIGSPQIRNVATLGGNVISAQPAADTTIALLALDAQVRYLNQGGEYAKPVREIFIGPGRSLLDPTREIATAFEFRVPGTNEATAFVRHAKRKALALPIVNLGVWVKADRAISKFEAVRIALGPMAPVPFRAENAEKVLKGAPCSESAIREAMEALAQEVTPRDSIRGGAAYKKEMAKVMLKRALHSALRELGGAAGA